MEQYSSSSSSSGVHQPPPSPVTRSEPDNPYPATFIQADTSSFKQVVQMLTGSTGRPDAARHAIPPVRSGPRKDKPGSKLYERRSVHKSIKISSPGILSIRHGLLSGSPRPGMLSPSILDFPSLALCSPITPLVPDPFNRAVAAEDRAIGEKGFYLHPSPVNTPRDSEPRLLPLFPLTSPRLSGSSSTDVES
ncbi:VQ motif-containing protein 4-like [Salvia hispanica]|uniref:VQ motif-containing protein 4-like n=1 Tax=Salvia hispanica TaxID=49212 RepID=UPI0020090F0A|nr:VQ motif-containing protein 4-like [Salvia hispanica]